MRGIRGARALAFHSETLVSPVFLQVRIRDRCRHHLLQPIGRGKRQVSRHLSPVLVNMFQVEDEDILRVDFSGFGNLGMGLGRNLGDRLGKQRAVAWFFLKCEE